MFVPWILAALLNAQSIVGVSYYAIQARTFPCSAALRVFKGVENPTTAFVWNSFGTERRCLQRFLRLDGNKTLQIHATNEVCRKYPRCGPGEILRHLSVKTLSRRLEKGRLGILAKYRNRFLAIRNFIYDDVGEKGRILFSPALEDSFSHGAVEQLIRISREVMIDIPIVHNPVKPITRRYADFIEYHGLQLGAGSPCIFNADGVNLGEDLGRRNDTDFLRRSRINKLMRDARKCRFVFLWEATAQGLYGGPFVGPRFREFRISPKVSAIFNTVMRRNRYGRS